MDGKKRNYCISTFWVFVAVLFTVLVKTVDVKNVGVEGTEVGFSTVNKFVFDAIGVNMSLYHFTEILGIVSIFIAVIYGVFGIVQLIRRKSLLKVDKELIILGIFYIFVMLVYALFEIVVINYRPVLIEGDLEASYPSSHTLMTICICGGAMIANQSLLNGKIKAFSNVFLIAIIFATVVGRLISGVHWFTDIIGGIFISMALLMSFYSVVRTVKK